MITTSRRTPDAAGHPRRVLGVMSGTSGDGIDVACIDLRGRGASMRVRFLWHHHVPFAPALRRRLLAVMAPAVAGVEEIARLHAELGEAYAAAVLQAVRANRSGRAAELIGLAGQTVCHRPGRPGRTVTLQLGAAARVAARTGLLTVADFRQADVAAGGQGAPLVPWTDWVLFRSNKIARAVQNIGGIGNVTWLRGGASAEQVVAFDTGPGNMVIDALVEHVTGGRAPMDRDGRRAARGRVLDEVLAEWLQHPYFKIKPPKSTGRETFGRPFVARQIPRLSAASRSPDDWIATATAFTAQSIVTAYRHYLPGFPIIDHSARKSPVLPKRARLRGRTVTPQANVELVICGGGARNRTLLAMLTALLPLLKVRTIDSYNIPAEAKEAVSFAMLAAACVDSIPANLPQVTGATRPALLGQIVRP